MSLSVEDIASIKSTLSYNPETGVFIREASVFHSKKGSVAGSSDSYGYRCIKIGSRKFKAHILAFVFMTGSRPPEFVDHINGDPADNRWVNLRARKKKRCSNPSCSEEFTPQRLGQKVCSPACGLATKDVNADRARKALADVGRKELRAAKERVKPKGQYMREAQAAVNAYVRERDRKLPCISCGTSYPDDRVNVWDAGHLRSVGASPATRFNLFNINKQCVRCNRYLSANAVMYKAALIEKIGFDRVEKLYCTHKAKAFSIEYLVRIKNIFKRRIKILRKIREARFNHVA